VVFKKKFLSIFLVIFCLSFFDHVVLRSMTLTQTIVELKQNLTKLVAKLSGKELYTGKTKATYKSHQEFMNDNDISGLQNIKFDYYVTYDDNENSVNVNKVQLLEIANKLKQCKNSLVTLTLNFQYDESVEEKDKSEFFKALVKFTKLTQLKLSDVNENNKAALQLKKMVLERARQVVLFKVLKDKKGGKESKSISETFRREIAYEICENFTGKSNFTLQEFLNDFDAPTYTGYTNLTLNLNDQEILNENLNLVNKKFNDEKGSCTRLINLTINLEKSKFDVEKMVSLFKTLASHKTIKNLNINLFSTGVKFKDCVQLFTTLFPKNVKMQNLKFNDDVFDVYFDDKKYSKNDDSIEFLNDLKKYFLISKELKLHNITNKYLKTVENLLKNTASNSLELSFNEGETDKFEVLEMKELFKTLVGHKTIKDLVIDLSSNLSSDTKIKFEDRVQLFGVLYPKNVVMIIAKQKQLKFDNNVFGIYFLRKYSENSSLEFLNEDCLKKYFFGSKELELEIRKNEIVNDIDLKTVANLLKKMSNLESLKLFFKSEYYSHEDKINEINIKQTGFIEALNNSNKLKSLDININSISGKQLAEILGKLSNISLETFYINLSKHRLDDNAIKNITTFLTNICKEIKNLTLNFNGCSISEKNLILLINAISVSKIKEFYVNASENPGVTDSFINLLRKHVLSMTNLQELLLSHKKGAEVNLSEDEKKTSTEFLENLMKMPNLTYFEESRWYNKLDKHKELQAELEKRENQNEKPKQD
jgi:hypothetical protein